MFGSKPQKEIRLRQEAELIAGNEGISPAEIARRLGVHRSTISKDLADLQQAGVLLAEDDRGCLSLFSRKR